MFVRQTIIHTAIDKIDEASKLFEESVIPAFRSQKGYQGASFISLFTKDPFREGYELIVQD